MDALSSLLSLHQVRGTVLNHGTYQGQWGIALDDSDVAGFHVVLEGACVLLVADRPPTPLGAGDVVVLPRGVGHALADAPSSPVVPLTDLLRRSPSSSTAPAPSSGPVTQLCCGAYAFSSGGVSTALAALPAVIVVRRADVEADELMSQTLGLLRRELMHPEQPGAQLVTDRLTEALFVGVLRRFLDGKGGACAGWLAALRDDGLARAIAAMHERPAADWQVHDLAKLAGMSRATFARRFDAAVGTSPAAFLQRLRLEAAERLLKESDASIAEVARAVGYQSEFSFSRAFKRHTGVPPSAARRSGLRAA